MENFAFLIHPLHATDVAHKFAFAGRFSDEWVEKVLKHLLPMSADHWTGIRGLEAQAEGFLVATMLTARQMSELPLPYVLRKIIAAGRKAERMGAKIVGLGAMTSVVGDAGITVARHLSIPVTTGQSYTVSTALQATLQATSLMGIDVRQATLCVIGATGALGRVCAQMMASTVGRLVLAVGQRESLETVANEIYSESAVLGDIHTDVRQAVRVADIVIVASGSADVQITPEEMKPGAVVCDLARPRGVAQTVGPVRDDVLVIDGGLVEVPGGFDSKFSLGLPPGLVYASMAETMLLALERRYECYTLGRSLQVEQVLEIDKLAQKHGFQLAGFRSGEGALALEQIARIRAKAEQNKQRTAGPGILA